MSSVVDINSKKPVQQLPELSTQGGPMTIQECVRASVRAYLRDMGDHPPEDLYRLVLAEVEKPLLEEVMRHTGWNQVRTAIALGISRGTLRKKLRIYGLN